MAINGNINKLFVPYEIALKLKEKGFDEPCYGCRITVDNLFKNNDDVHVYSEPKNYNNWNGRLSAPLYQQVIDWFREKNIQIIELPTQNFRTIKWAVSDNGKFKGGFPLDKAIEEALKLIP